MATSKSHISRRLPSGLFGGSFAARSGGMASNGAQNLEDGAYFGMR